MRKLIALTGNTQRLDGGAMFGNVPKAVWSKWAPPDAQNRIELVWNHPRRILQERQF